MLSFLFIILWSSAFISTKIIVTNASPLLSLSFRFAIVALGFFCYSFYYKEKILVKLQNILESCFSGILFHGLYLGGCFYSFSIGVPANITALIVSMQPILTNLLAGPILHEKVTWRQWIGIILGFFGATLVLGLDVGSSIPLIGIIATLIALLAATIGTLWQKKLSNNIPLSVSNFYQAVGASIFLFFIMVIFEKPFINFNLQFVLSMSWQILAVSFGAFTMCLLGPPASWTG